MIRKLSLAAAGVLAFALFGLIGPALAADPVGPGPNPGTPYCLTAAGTGYAPCGTAANPLVVTGGGTPSSPSSDQIVGPLGPSVGPAAAVAVAAQDDFNVCDGVINTCTASGTTVLFCKDTQGYQSISTQVTTAGSGTITYEQSDDSTNGCSSTTWNVAAGVTVSSLGTSAPVNTTTSTASSLVFQKRQRYFRARVSSFASGPIVIIGTLHSAPSVNILAELALQAGSSAIGKVGPGLTSTQTQINGNATGTTGAVVGTLAGAASKTTWICDFDVSAIGGTAAVGPIVVAGLLGGSKTYQMAASASGSFLVKQFTPCIQASAQNTAITVTTTADGTASGVAVNSSGYQE